jgi:hypothetical protein
MKTYKGSISELKENQIFVFGSNTQGRHGKGTALMAREKFGAKYGQASGLQGQSWGMITTDLTKSYRPSVLKSKVILEINKLYEYASQNTELEFLVAYTGLNNRNLSGFTNQEFADMFSYFTIPDNIIFEEQFSTLLKRK